MSNQRTSVTTHCIETPSGRIGYASAGSGPATLLVQSTRLVMSTGPDGPAFLGHDGRCAL